MDHTYDLVIVSPIPESFEVGGVIMSQEETLQALENSDDPRWTDHFKEYGPPAFFKGEHVRKGTRATNTGWS